MAITKKPAKELSELRKQVEECKRVVKDLDILFEGMVDYGVNHSKAASVIIGLAITYDYKFDKLDDMITALEEQLPPVIEDRRTIT